MPKRRSDVEVHELDPQERGKHATSGDGDEGEDGAPNVASEEKLATRKIFQLKRRPAAVAPASIPDSAPKFGAVAGDVPKPSFNWNLTGDNAAKPVAPAATTTTSEATKPSTTSTPAAAPASTTTAPVSSEASATTTKPADTTAPTATADGEKKPLLPAFSFSALAASNKTTNSGFSFKFSAAPSTGTDSDGKTDSGDAGGSSGTAAFGGNPVAASLFTPKPSAAEDKDESDAGDSVKKTDSKDKPAPPSIAQGEEDDCNLLEVKAKLYRLETQAARASTTAENTPAVGVADAKTKGGDGDGEKDKSDRDDKKVAEGTASEDKNEGAPENKKDSDTTPTGPQEWVQKGMGQLRFNVHNKSKVARVIVRHDGTQRLVLNASLIPGKKPELAGEKSVRAILFDISTNKPDVFVIRVPTATDATALHKVMTEFLDNNQPTDAEDKA